MAEYCSQCSPFDNEFDVDLFKTALKVKRGHSIDFICEGCNNRGIYKDEKGLIYLVKLENNELTFHLVNLENL